MERLIIVALFSLLSFSSSLVSSYQAQSVVHKLFRGYMSHIHINPSVSTDKQSNGMNDGKVGIIIIDHGSKKVEANEMLNDICEEYKSRFDHAIVEPAHMELAEPSIMTACKRCIEYGVTKIVCHPYFLGRGRHVQEDIPRLIAEVRSAYPHIEIVMTQPTGLNPKIIDIIQDSLKDVL